MAAATTGGTSPSEDFPPLMNGNNGSTNADRTPIMFASLLKPKINQPVLPVVPIKPVSMLHGEPNITWKSSEVKSLIVKENL